MTIDWGNSEQTGLSGEKIRRKMLKTMAGPVARRGRR